MPTDHLLKTPREDEFDLRGLQEVQPQASGCSQLQLKRPTARVGPVRFSKETYESILQAYGPIPREVKILSDTSQYSFVALARRRSYPVISITETGGQLSEITIDLDGKIKTLHENNFCRIPGCGYWLRNTGRIIRHRLTHFDDRGFECPNPYRNGTGAPENLMCRLAPGQYVTRSDIFKEHLRALNCQAYAQSYVQRKDHWRGPRGVDELYLLPFTRNVHIPFK